MSSGTDKRPGDISSRLYYMNAALIERGGRATSKKFQEVDYHLCPSDPIAYSANLDHLLSNPPSNSQETIGLIGFLLA